jgi:hypothetical protein
MPNRRELGYVSAGSTSTIVATTGYGVATGGTSSSPNISGQDYTVLTFSSDDNLVVSSAGLFDVLVGCQAVAVRVVLAQPVVQAVALVVAVLLV